MTVATSAAILAPYGFMRLVDQHNMWVSLWEGLGNFGADRGYSWYDVDAKAVLAKAGITPFATPRHVTPEQERFFREAVVRDVSAHPLWYASILARRVVATIGMTHLRPHRPWNGYFRTNHALSLQVHDSR